MREQSYTTQERENFRRICAIDDALNPSFEFMLKRLMKNCNKSSEALAQDMGVSTETIKRYRTGETAPDLRMAVAICISFGLDLRQSERLLNSLGFTLSGTKKEHCAYRLLIEKCRGKTVADCNLILSELGFTRAYRLYPRKNR